MALWYAVMLGLVQGLTEFLPVSSSGHLALAQRLLPGFSQPGLMFDLTLHVGTVAAVVAMEWRRVVQAVRERFAVQLGAQLVIGTLATAVVAFPLRHVAESAFVRPLLVALGLAVTGVLLLALGRAGRDHHGSMGAGVPWRTVIVVGLVQGFAVWPGLSRSGSTISAAVLLGVDRRWAADFSFLLSVPAVLGAALVESWRYRADLLAIPASEAWVYVAGGVVAAVTGAAALVAVRRLVERGRLSAFAFYVLPLAAVVAAVSLFWGR